MSSVAVHTHLSSIIEAVATGDRQALATRVQRAITRAEDASELLGQIGLLAMRGDPEGHTVLMLGAAAMLARKLIALRRVLGEDGEEQVSSASLVLQVLPAAAAAVQAGRDASLQYPTAIFPSALAEGETVASRMHQAIDEHDALLLERLLFGLYGTGADYRTISIRIYDALSETFEHDGHALLYAVRGAQVLDAGAWGEDAPHYLHWLAPHLPRQGREPAWLETVRSFLRQPEHSLESYRRRLAAPKNEHALPLRPLLHSAASPDAVCQGVYDALITHGASAGGIGSVLALAACDLVQKIDDGAGDLFLRAAHGLLYASATRLTCTQVQESEALPQLFTAACAIHALHAELGGQLTASRAIRSGLAGGGLIAPALLESMSEQIAAQQTDGALATAHRYIQLGYDPQALIATIGLQAARADPGAEQGHALQLILASGDEYLAWPGDLAGGPAEGFLQIALRAATRARRTTAV